MLQIPFNPSNTEVGYSKKQVLLWEFLKKVLMGFAWELAQGVSLLLNLH